jgi:hypothetical protein
VLLAPVVVELLYGAVRVSTIFVLIPEFMTWGCGALLIRECIRRWRKDWQSMLLMGLALAVSEEWVIQQTSISPLVGIGQHAYGRAWGVNWVYFLWALGYESVWVVLLPVQLTELLFPDRRAACWLRTRGLVIAGVFFALGVFVAWYGWTQRARVKIFHMAPYGPPPAYLLTGIVAILALIVAAYALPLRQTRERNAVSHASPSPWTIGWGTCALGSGWAIFFLLGWGVGVFPTVPFAPVLAAALAWALVTFLLMRRWTSGVDWGDAHRFAIVFGGVMACMIGGFVIFKVDGALLIDWIGKAILNLAALAGLIALALRVRRRKRSNTQA